MQKSTQTVPASLVQMKEFVFTSMKLTLLLVSVEMTSLGNIVKVFNRLTYFFNIGLTFFQGKTISQRPFPHKTTVLPPMIATFL